MRSVVHKRSEWVKKVRVRGKVKVAGTQQIDRCWNHLKKFCPSQMKHRTGATINGRFWDRIYQWIYRHNTSNWPKTNHLRAEKIACATFRREVHKIQFWKIAKNEAFWHIDVKNAGLWKSVLPCLYVRTYVRTYLHTYIHTYIHTYVPTYVRTYVPTYIHTYIHTYVRTYLPTYPNTASLVNLVFRWNYFSS